MSPAISGRTVVFGILADPIHQVQTPQLMNAWIAERGLDAVMVPFFVPRGELERAVAGLRTMPNLGGFIVTVPHKTQIIELCDDVSERAAAIGAANTVRREADGRLVADMLDGIGFVAGLRTEGVEPEGRRAFMAGAGGAANAIAFGLAEAGIAHLTIGNRTPSRAGELVERLRTRFPALPTAISTDPAGHSLAVNATSLGMRDEDPLPFDVERADADATVAEIIMAPERTALLQAADRRGLRVHTGRPMLACQIDLMAAFLQVAARSA